MPETTTSEKIELKVPRTLKALIEALIFAAKEPLSIAQIKSIYLGENKNDESHLIDADLVKKTVTELNKEFEKSEKPYRIVAIAGGYQFATMSEYAEWLGRLYKEQGRRKLSQSGVETLAIIAYKQPITKSEVEKIRGVNCDYVLKTLLEKELVTVTGRAESVGRPLLYGTTKEFLKHFGLNDITDLPRPREIEEILGESQFETERRMLEAQAGAETMKKEQDDFKSRLPHIPKKKSELPDKEASIQPHRRTREIKIVPNEPAQQEAIAFKPNNDIPDDNAVEQEIAADEKLPAAEAVAPSEVIAETPGAVEHHNDTGFSKDDRGTSEKYAAHEDANAASKVAPLERKEQSAEIAAGNSDHPGRTAYAAGSKPTWKVWKEKIQGFIKKLFD